MGNEMNLDDGPLALSALEELSVRTAERAARAREHATEARERARRDAAQGNRYAERLHVREAEAHEGAARVIEQTAALYRHRLWSLTRRKP